MTPAGYDDATRAAWEQVFAHQLDGLPVLRVIVTHMHPDHIGLAQWLTERWNCRLWISATDWHAARLASQDTPGQGGDRSADFFARNGLTDEGVLKRVRERRNYYATLVPEVPLTYRRLLDRQALEVGGRTWHCVAGYGHAPEHIALHCPALDTLISGDMVLPRISSNVSVWENEPEADPLPLYLDSLRQLRTLPASTLVLPSHGKPFTGLHERIDQLLAHHEERFADVLVACREAPRSAADLLSVIFRRPLDLHQTTFAMGEAIAHVHALEGRGALVRTEGADGVLRYQTAAG